METTRALTACMLAILLGFALAVPVPAEEAAGAEAAGTEAEAAEAETAEAESSAQDAGGQESDDEGEPLYIGEIIEVIGIAGSLANNAEIKMEQAGVVDAITAEAIGRFPDTNLAESMQRIPGVSIDRRNNEGNQISVRGFGPSFNLVTLNGRQMPSAATAKQEGDSTAEQSRGFNFAEIAAESIAGVRVYKTARADVPTGGIGATVDIQTARPFDLGKLTAVASVKATSDLSNEVGDDYTPEVSALASNVFADGRVGVLFTGSYSERDSRENFVATDGWLRVGNANIDDSAIDRTLNPTGQVWLPRNLVVDQSDHLRTRLNMQGVLQFQPHYRFQATLDYTVSDYEDEIERSQTGIWFESPNPTGATDANGSVINPTIILDPLRNFGAFDFLGYSDMVKTENESIGLNLDWQVTDSLNLSLDMHDSSSEAQPGDLSSDFLVILTGPLGISTTVNYGGGDLPTTNIDDTQVPILNPGLTGFADPDGLRPNIDLLRNKGVKNEVQQAQFRGSWTPASDGPLSAINFGASFTDYQIDTEWVFDLGVQGLVPCGAQCPDFVSLEDTHFPNIFPLISVFSAREVFDSFVGDMTSFFDLAFENRHRVSEETTAAYIQLEYDQEIGGKRFRALGGLRYETTDVTGTTLQNAPEAMVYVTPTEFRPRFTDDVVEYSIDSDYDFWLPSLDLSLEVTDSVITRLSYGKTLTRSDLNSMKPALSIGDARPGGPYNASQGNPGLLPYESDNLDFSLEWYYDEGSYAAVTLFKKWVDNYVVSTITQAPIQGALGYDLTDPNPGDDPNFPANTPGGPDDQVILWDIASFANGDSAEVEGLEVALQHIFGDSGFGAQLNFTLVEGDVEYDVRALDQSVALTGLSDSANFVAFYERERYRLRLAYNWRDEFLLAANQLRQMNEPVFVEEYGQLDARFSYELMPEEGLTIYLEGINLTEEPFKAHGRFDNQFLRYADQEARYSLGLTSRF